MTDVKEILIDWLKANGYDGLYNPDGGCWCGCNDFAICDYIPLNCKPAYKQNKSCLKCTLRCDAYVGVEMDCWGPEQ